ncbi:hypothetical protein [Sulfurospirillum arcachonense]|uniref:hypothetical protein n=1 Tax=Sulfurospirillum arcachonense TaxID=57666 RepID=UPI0004690773|nr:hypothetical protein [Sulfurospirillum arcachonense]
MKQVLVLLFIFITYSLAQNKYDINNSTNTSQKVKSIFLSYENIPTKVYVGEVFPLKIKAIIANNNFEEITSSFSNSENIKVINPDAKWQWFSDNIFYNTFYIKINDNTSQLPDITLSIHQDSLQIDSATIKALNPTKFKLNGTKYFSNVIAKSLKIKKHKMSQFDDKSYIIVLEVEAEQSNLEDFKLQWVTRDGIDSSVDNLPYHRIFYYAIIPNFEKKFDFTYFNTQNNKFEKFSIPIVVDDDSVSTQIDLNPQDSSIQIYIDGAYGVIALILIILFIRRRKITYLILIIMLFVLFAFDKNPLNSIRIDKNTKIKILPTKKSTIFYTTNRTLYAQKLDAKDDYIKILLPNGKIGWIKEQSDTKN